MVLKFYSHINKYQISSTHQFLLDSIFFNVVVKLVSLSDFDEDRTIEIKKRKHR